MSEKIYVIGHKSPDLDSVAAAISYANFKNKNENTGRYIPAVAGKINRVTEFVLKKFSFEAPEILTGDERKNVILVDHNEVSQRYSDSNNINIIEIIDHHKVNLNYGDPIEIIIRPWGASNSIIYKLYKKNKIEIDKNMAGLLLSAILDDTMITKSPTCTNIDIEIIKELSEMTGVENWEEYGMEMFRVKSSVSDMSAEELCKKCDVVFLALPHKVSMEFVPIFLKKGKNVSFCCN